MGMSSGSNRGAMSEINVTPLVDVMLVLLIIFMVTAPMMNDAGVEINLPESDAPPLMEDTEDVDQLILTLDRESNVYIGENMHRPEELPAKLSAIAKARPDARVFLRADGEVPYREVASLLGIARRAGMPKVGLVFEPTSSTTEDQ